MPGHQRVRWTNAYGKKLYDDYVENEPGALQALEDYLNTSAYYRSRPGGGHGRASAGFLRSFFPRSPAKPSSSSSGGIADRLNDNDNENAKRNRPPKDIELGRIPHTTLLLFSVMEKVMYKVHLYQGSVEKITND